MGVPQGGALSCVIANVVLHSADDSVLHHQQAAPTLTYLRYCDDMIVVAPTRSACSQAFSDYRRALLRLKLPYHRAKAVIQYSVDFWQGKSRKPYLWSHKSRHAGVPWIQFVGYQIRYDGVVRIRPKSIQKHIQKLVSTTDQMLRVLYPSGRSENQMQRLSDELRKNKNEIRHRFRMKLLALSVGRVSLTEFIDGPRPACWASGFKGLHGKRFPAHHLKRLDRHRERQMLRLWRRIKMIASPNGCETKRAKALSHYGKPFSLQAQLKACGISGLKGSKGSGM
ncbi:MAG: reverse transcriptase domain-containing protein [Chthoniobacteraceae bacterium]